MPGDESDDSTEKTLPPVTKRPLVRARPSFITNRDFTPSLLVFVSFILLFYVVQWAASKSPDLGFVAATVVFILLAVWERRARHEFGRVRRRAHFDSLSLAKLPIVTPPPTLDADPLTPWLRQDEKTRTDPAMILKRAQETISGGGQASESEKSAMELALINFLKEAVREAEAPPPSEIKGP